MRDLLKEMILSSNKGKRFRELPKFPPVVRDVSFTVPSQVKSIEVSTAIKGYRSNLLKHYRLFDYYPLNNEKSFAYTLEFSDYSKTLNDEEINREIASLMSYLKKKLKAELRKSDG